jgi:hypothetical protein
MSTRFRRLTDLFVQGREVPLPDGTYLWVQAINAYERDECLSDAQVARARLILALKENGNERIKIEGRLVERGREAMEQDVVTARVDDKYSEILAALEDDPEWTERLAILRRSDFSQSAKPADPAEILLVEKILAEWTAHLNEAVENERAWQASNYSRMSDEELLDDYMELWLDRRGSDVATAEYALTELWYATRYCEATANPDGVLDHNRCEGHPERVFATKADARAIPDALHALITKELAALSMEGRDPKGSDNPTSSSGSSPTPSEAEGSTPSTSGETPPPPPGISPEPSVTP